MEVTPIPEARGYLATNSGSYIVMQCGDKNMHKYTVHGIYLGPNNHRALTEAEAVIAEKHGLTIYRDLNFAYSEFIENLMPIKPFMITPISHSSVYGGPKIDYSKYNVIEFEKALPSGTSEHFREFLWNSSDRFIEVLDASVQLYDTNGNQVQGLISSSFGSAINGKNHWHSECSDILHTLSVSLDQAMIAKVVVVTSVA